MLGCPRMDSCGLPSPSIQLAMHDTNDERRLGAAANSHSWNCFEEKPFHLRVNPCLERSVVIAIRSEAHSSCLPSCVTSANAVIISIEYSETFNWNPIENILFTWHERISGILVFLAAANYPRTARRCGLTSWTPGFVWQSNGRLWHIRLSWRRHGQPIVTSPTFVVMSIRIGWLRKLVLHCVFTLFCQTNGHEK